jgi:hypothetical protein
MCVCMCGGGCFELSLEQHLAILFLVRIKLKEVVGYAVFSMASMTMNLANLSIAPGQKY